MKKSGLAFLVASIISAAACAMPAETLDLNGYHGGSQPLITDKSRAKFYPATDISIINASDRMIMVSVPNTPVSGWIYTNSSPYHVTHTGGSFYTNIVIQDSSYYTIFSQTVCPRALITIFGSYGHYTWNVDEEYCR